MKNFDFVHLHVHTSTSFLDGAIKFKDLAKKCKELNMPMVITDHGNVCGTVKAYKAAKEEDIDFIRGIELYIEKVENEDSEEEDYEGKYYHLVLLPYTQEGFENINYLSSMGYLHGLVNVAGRNIPVVKRKFLKENNKGIVALSACMFGEVSSAIWYNFKYVPYIKEKDINFYNEIVDLIIKKIIENNNSLFFKINKNNNIINDIKVAIRNNEIEYAKVTIRSLLNDSLIDRLIITDKKMQELKQLVYNYADKYINDFIEFNLKNEDYTNKILEVINYYNNIYDYFFLEVQDHKFFEQKLTTLVLINLKEKGLIKNKIVITNDAHYLNKNDWKIQDTLLCIATNKKIEDENRFKFDSKDLYIKTKEEMLEMFDYLPIEIKEEFIKNTVEVANICLNFKLKFNDMFYPKATIPNSFNNSDEYLLFLVVNGLKEKSINKDKTYRYKYFEFIDYDLLKNKIYKKVNFSKAEEYVKNEETQKLINSVIEEDINRITKEILDYTLKNNNFFVEKEIYKSYLESLKRIIYEFCIIKIKNISDYFLNVRKIIMLAHENQIWTGPGRGSAAGSAISYALNITELDPMEYDLLFERFINPERNSYPDIDSDFEEEYHKLVKTLISEHFGVDRTCSINAFSNIREKKALQDVLRVYNYDYDKVIKITKMIKTGEEDLLTQVQNNVELKEMYKKDEKFREMVELANKMVGIYRQPQSHAAGVLIVPKEIDFYKKCPVMIINKGQINSQYDKDDVEAAGFLKMDILGLRNLTIIRKAIELIKKYRGIDLDIKNIPLNDKETFKLYETGNLDFVFQTSSEGMKNFFKKLKPKHIEDIIVGLAGYRPGPLDYLPQFIEVKNGVKKAEYLHPKLKPILEVTGGIPFYQEQIMAIFKDLAGYTLGRADLVRRAMGKKKKEILDKEKENFIYGITKTDEAGNEIIEVPGCIRNGIPKEVAEKIYEMIIPFADYGFNKSHAAAYALLSYRTAYLKAHYYLEYATSVLMSVETNKDKLKEYSRIVKKDGIKVLKPDINKSNVNINIYNYTKKELIAGLVSIKGIGEEVAENIVKEREANGKFKSFEEFLIRMKNKVDKGVVYSLIYSGSFDEINNNIEELIDIYERKNDLYTNYNLNNTFYQLNIFNNYFNTQDTINRLNNINYNLKIQKLIEYNLIDVTDYILSLIGETNSNNVNEIGEYKNYKLIGIVTEELKLSKNGKAYVIKITDMEGNDVKIIVTNKEQNSEQIQILKDIKLGTIIEMEGTYKITENKDTDEETEEENIIINRIFFCKGNLKIKTINKGIEIAIDLENFIKDNLKWLKLIYKTKDDNVTKLFLNDLFNKSNDKEYNKYVVYVKYKNQVYKREGYVNIEKLKYIHKDYVRIIQK